VRNVTTTINNICINSNVTDDIQSAAINQHQTNAEIKTSINTSNITAFKNNITEIFNLINKKKEKDIQNIRNTIKKTENWPNYYSA